MKKILLFVIIIFLMGIGNIKADTISDLLLYKGILLFEQNDPLSINLLLEAHNRDITNPTPLYYMGIYHLRIGNIDDAIYYLKKVIEFHDNRFINAYYDLGRVYLWKGEYKKARKNFYEYLKVFKNDPFGKFYYSIAKLFTGGNSTILKHFNNSATLLPELRDVANYYIAFSYLHWQDRDKAEEWLKIAEASTDNPKIKKMTKRFLYFLSQDQNYYKRYGFSINSFSGYDSNPMGNTNKIGSSFSNLDLRGFYLTTPGKFIQLGLNEIFNSKFYFSSDIRSQQEYISITSIDLFFPFTHSSLGIEGSISYQGFSSNNNTDLSYDNQKKYGLSIFGDFAGILLNTFRFGATLYTIDNGEWIKNGKGIELFLRDFYIFDAGKSSFVSSFSYLTQDADFFSKFGPKVDFYINKYFLWKLYADLYLSGSVYNFNSYLQNRTENSLLYKSSIYIKWIKFFSTGLTLGNEEKIDRQQSFNRNWMGIWLKGQF